MADATGGDERVPIVSPQGVLGDVPRADLPRAIAQGYQPPSPEQLAGLQREQDAQGPAQTLAAAGEGALSAATFGIGPAVEAGLGISTPEAMAARKEAHPIARGVGQAAGIIAPLLLTAGASAPAQGAMGAARGVAELTAPALIARAGQAVAAGVKGAGLGGTLGRLAPFVAGGAAEGALYSGADVTEKALLGDPQLTWEKAAAEIGMGGLFGGALAGTADVAARGLGKLLTKASAGLETVAQHVAEGDPAVVKLMLNAKTQLAELDAVAPGALETIAASTPETAQFIIANRNRIARLEGEFPGLTDILARAEPKTGKEILDNWGKLLKDPQARIQIGESMTEAVNTAYSDIEGALRTVNKEIRPAEIDALASKASPEVVHQTAADLLGKVEGLAAKMRAEPDLFQSSAAREMELIAEGMKRDGVALQKSEPFAVAAPKEFELAKAELTKTRPDRAAFLAPKAAEDYQHLTPYLSTDGKIGYGITHDGDLVNVFNVGEKRGAGRQAVVSAIRRGARTLDCYDGALPSYYSKFGFVETGRMKWNDAFAPAGWDYTKRGRPDIVFMTYRDGPPSTIAERVGTFPASGRTGAIEHDWDKAKLRSRQSTSHPRGEGPEPGGGAGAPGDADRLAAGDGRAPDGRGGQSGGASTADVGSGGPADVFRVLNRTKQLIDAQARFGKLIPPEWRRTADALKSLRSDFKSALEDTGVWGAAAERQAAFNSAQNAYFTARKAITDGPAFQKLMQKVTLPTGAVEYEANPRSINSWINLMADNRGGAKTDSFASYLKSARQLADEMEKSGYAGATDVRKLIDTTAERANDIRQRGTITQIVKMLQGHEILSSGPAIPMGRHIALEAAKRLPGGVGHIVGSITGTIGKVRNPATQVAVLSTLDKYAKRASAKLAHGVEGIFRTGTSGAAASGVSERFAEGGVVTPERFGHVATALRDYGGSLDRLATQVAGETSHLQDHAPGAAAEAHAFAARLVQHLGSKLPDGGPRQLLDPPFEPGPSELAAYNRHHEIAARGPVAVLEHLARGTLHPDHLDASQTIYPRMHAEAVHLVAEELAEHLGRSEKLPHGIRAGLGMVLGSDLEHSMTPAAILSAQLAYGGPPPPSQEATGGIAAAGGRRSRNVEVRSSERLATASEGNETRMRKA